MIIHHDKSFEGNTVMGQSIGEANLHWTVREKPL